jgi:hypothetical protein
MNTRAEFRLLVLTLVALAGCATLRSEPDDTTIVQVREYNRSPTVNVVAWAPDDNGYGLQAMVRRDGTLLRDHRFYVSTAYLGAGFFRNTAATFGHAGLDGRRFIEMIAPQELLLEREGIVRDVHYCFGWPRCSPRETGGARVPDSVLRASRDSVSLKFYDRYATEMIVTLRRDVIDPYLRAVDSVSAALRGKQL